MQINLFPSLNFELIKQTVNRHLTPQQQMICAVAVIAFSCLATAYLSLHSCFKATTTVDHLGVVDDASKMTYHPEFENGLDLWVLQEGGKAKIAADRIRIAYYKKEHRLNLTFLGLKTLPSEIGKLEYLGHLDAYCNELENLPSSIGNLLNLYKLSLWSNKLDKLPESIVNLAGLENLNLANNNFENLHESMGNLLKLKYLDLHDNPIHNLPISLGQCSQLTYLGFEKTHISVEQKDAILAMCVALRAKKAAKVLPTRLKAWQTFAGQTFELDFIEKLTEIEKQILNEWLTRLERTHDFNIATHQKKLAKSVCQMLESLEKSPSFKEIFFIQVPPNLVACGDRAAMSFNELGLAWTCDNLFLATHTEKEKINILIQTAKTLALHHALQKHIGEEEIKTSTEIKEDVEIYLYYEIHLKDKLNLLTFISDMLYSGIEKRDWIKEKDLIAEVNKDYQKTLLNLPALLLLCKTDAQFNADWQKIEDDLYEEIEKIHPGDLKEGEYTLQMDKLKQSFENQKEALMLNWVESKLSM